MEPRVPSGALCLFGPPNAPPFGDRIFLVAHTALDGDLDGPFALKRIEVKSRIDGKRRFTLVSLNPTYPPIALNERASDDLRVVATFLEVLVRPELT